jgi:acetoin utilization deacetylase AcuC-like enzyme
MPLYPGTGNPSFTGVGNICNAALPAGSGTEAMREAYDGRILPALEAFRPDFLFISAGFDADYRDPLAGLSWKPEDFAWVTGRLTEVADRVCEGRIVSMLEGGYDRQGLATGVSAHVEMLMGAS